MPDTHEKIRVLAEQAAGSYGVRLVGAELLGKGARSVLKVTIDKEGGVSLGDCEAVSRELEALLDVEDPIPGRYTLEVTSPGLDRPLRSIGDFAESAGKKARIILRTQVDGQSFFVGRIQGVHDGTVLLDTGKGVVDIPYAEIKKARLEIEL